MVPSPPSPTGSDMVRASGHAFLIPFLIDVVASRAVKLPLNESGAIIIFICHHFYVNSLECIVIVQSIILRLIEVARFISLYSLNDRCICHPHSFTNSKSAVTAVYTLLYIYYGYELLCCRCS